MAGTDEIRRRVARAKRTVRRAVEEARARSRATGGDQPGGISVGRRRNVVVAANRGAPGAVEVASARQVVAIAQTGTRDAGETAGR